MPRLGWRRGGERGHLVTAWWMDMDGKDTQIGMEGGPC